MTDMILNIVDKDEKKSKHEVELRIMKCWIRVAIANWDDEGDFLDAEM